MPLTNQQRTSTDGVRKQLIASDGSSQADAVAIVDKDGNAMGVGGQGELTNDAWGIPKGSHPFSLFYGMWTYDIPVSMWFMYENGTQVYTSTNIISSGGVAQLTADATHAAVILESRECPRYQPNRGHLFSNSGWMPDKTADGTRDWGIFTVDNGVFFRLKPDGFLYAVRRSGGLEVAEELIDTSGLTGFDVEKNNIYDIQFQWRSAGNYNFFIGDPGTGFPKLVHTFNLLGALTSASIENPASPIAFEATRITEDVEMNIGCADVSSENGSLAVHQYESAHADGVEVITDTPIVVIKSPVTIGSKINTRTIQLARITVTCDKKAIFRVWATRDPTAFTGGTFVAIGGGSFIETDSPDEVAGAARVTAIDTAKLNHITAIPVQAAETHEVDNPLRERITFPIVRGDYLVVSCTAANGNADVVIEWGEQI